MADSVERVDWHLGKAPPDRLRQLMPDIARYGEILRAHDLARLEVSFKGDTISVVSLHPGGGSVYMPESLGEVIEELLRLRPFTSES